MKIIAKIPAIPALFLLLSAGANDVRALCSIPGTAFTSNTFNAPIGQDVSLTSGVFWGIGQFDPTHPGGTDSGIVSSSNWLRYWPSAGFYLAGDWAGDLGFDGCIQDLPNPQPGKMGAAWTTSDGIDSYFVALCAAEDPSGSYLGFLDIPGAPMTRVPRPVIRATSRAAGGVLNITAGHEPIVGGVYTTGGCALAVTGFRVYHQSVPRNAAAPGSPGSRNPDSGWTLLGTGTESATFASGQVACAADGDIYLMTTLVLDGNVELKQGSRNSIKVECGPNLATPGEGDFRYVRRPKTTKGR